MIHNAIVSIALKFFQALVTFWTIKSLIGEWGASEYGTWATMTSVIAYMSMFDFGVGFGVRNKIAESAGTSEVHRSDEYVSAGLILYVGISLPILLIGLAALVHLAPFNQHRTTASLLWLACVLSFVASYGNIILQGHGRFKLLNAIGLILPVGWLLIIRTRLVPEANSGWAAIVYGVLLLSQSYFALACAHRYSRLRISWNQRVTAHCRELARSGLKFFGLQISALTLFYSGNVLLFNFGSPAEVARYDAATKVFSIFSVGFSILVSIAWTEISRAKARNDKKKLREISNFLTVSAVGVLLLALVLASLSTEVFPVLTGVILHPSEAFWFAALVGVQSLAFSGALYLNAFERLNGQLIFAGIGIPLFFATAIALLRIEPSAWMLPASTIIAIAPSTIFCIVAARQIIRS